MSPRGIDGGIARALVLIALAASLPSCWTAAIRTIPETRSPYDSLPESALRRLGEARAQLESGDPVAACSGLYELAAQFPENLPIGIWLQEAEIALGKTRSDPSDLRERYRKRAEDASRAEDAASVRNHATVTSLVLAARLEPDAQAAGGLLDRAEKLDPHCAWCSYGKAWLAARAGDWKEVSERIVRAKLADPGHMPTLWLETWMIARAGGLSEAITSLSTWIERAVDDPRIDSRLVLEARLDRALLAVQDGDPKLARKLLAELEDVTPDRMRAGPPPAGQTQVDPGRAWQARAWMIQAGAEQQLGDAPAALAAAQEAERSRPEEVLPLVQQAMLHELWLGDPLAAEADWTRALELSRADPALGSLLDRVRARVRLERYAASRAAPAQDSARSGSAEEVPVR